MKVMPLTCSRTQAGGRPPWPVRWITSFLALAVALAPAGCGLFHSKQSSETSYFTSGSRAADERASQRIAQAEQTSGSEGASQPNVQKAQVKKTALSTTASSDTVIKSAQAPGKLPLFDQLGGQAGISNIVADFIPRVMDDPRVNWDRKDVTRGGFSLHRSQSETWKATPQHVAMLRQHMAEFLALATGGPPHYSGRQLKEVHQYMHISDPEFDAAIGDLKATLDNLKVPDPQQKDLLAIVESTRPEIATER